MGFNSGFKGLSKSLYTYLPMKMEQTGCSATSAYKIQTPGNYPDESIQQREDCLLRMVFKETAN